MRTITIPYGNWGERTKTYDVIDEYKNFTLFLDDEFDEYKIANSKGLILLRNNLNKHLEDVSLENWKDWVDWVLSLNPNMSNVLNNKIDFKGCSPNGKLKDLF